MQTLHASHLSDLHRSHAKINMTLTSPITRVRHRMDYIAKISMMPSLRHSGLPSCSSISSVVFNVKPSQTAINDNCSASYICRLIRRQIHCAQRHIFWLSQSAQWNLALQLLQLLRILENGGVDRSLNGARSNVVDAN